MKKETIELYKHLTGLTTDLEVKKFRVREIAKLIEEYKDLIWLVTHFEREINPEQKAVLDDIVKETRHIISTLEKELVDV